MDSPVVEILASSLHPGDYIFNVTITRRQNRRTPPLPGEIPLQDESPLWGMAVVQVLENPVPLVTIEPLASNVINPDQILTLYGSGRLRIASSKQAN